MSKFAFGFLMLALSSLALDIFMPSGDLGDLPLLLPERSLSPG